uniref:ADOR42 n=1 Tax=Adoxophyes orana granulovirus TaxID=170617 RepID=A0A0A7UYA3_GVAO|nr:ADOR42 [Adoxophyes orana granulovirus]
MNRTVANIILDKHKCNEAEKRLRNLIITNGFFLIPNEDNLFNSIDLDSLNTETLLITYIKRVNKIIRKINIQNSEENDIGGIIDTDHQTMYNIDDRRQKLAGNLKRLRLKLSDVQSVKDFIITIGKLAIACHPELQSYSEDIVIIAHQYGISNPNVDAESIRNRLKDSEKLVKEFSEENKRFNNMILDNKKTLKRYTDNLVQCESNLEKSENNLKTSKLDLEALQSSKRILENDYALLKDENSKLLEDVKNYMVEITNLKHSMEVDNVAEEYKIKLDKCAAENTTLIYEITDLQTQKQNIQAEYDNLKTTTESLQKQLDECIYKLQNKNRNNYYSIAFADQSEEPVVDLDDETQSEPVRIISLDNNDNNQLVQVSDLEKHLHDCINDKHELQSQLINTQNTLSECNIKLQKSFTDNDLLQHQSQECSDKLKQKIDTNNILQQECKDKLSILEQNINLLQAQLQKSNQEKQDYIDRAEQDINLLQKKLKILEQDNNLLQERLKECDDKLNNRRQKRRKESVDESTSSKRRAKRSANDANINKRTVGRPRKKPFTSKEFVEQSDDDDDYSHIEMEIDNELDNDANDEYVNSLIERELNKNEIVIEDLNEKLKECQELNSVLNEKLKNCENQNDENTDEMRILKNTLETKTNELQILNSKYETLNYNFTKVNNLLKDKTLTNTANESQCQQLEHEIEIMENKLLTYADECHNQYEDLLKKVYIKASESTDINCLSSIVDLFSESDLQAPKNIVLNDDINMPKVKLNDLEIAVLEFLNIEQVQRPLVDNIRFYFRLIHKKLNDIYKIINYKYNRKYNLVTNIEHAQEQFNIYLINLSRDSEIVIEQLHEQISNYKRQLYAKSNLVDTYDDDDDNSISY